MLPHPIQLAPASTFPTPSRFCFFPRRKAAKGLVEAVERNTAWVGRQRDQVCLRLLRLPSVLRTPQPMTAEHLAGLAYWNGQPAP